MTMVTDPYSGLQMVELSHVWGHGVPSMPGQDDVKMSRSSSMPSTASRHTRSLR